MIFLQWCKCLFLVAEHFTIYSKELNALIFEMFGAFLKCENPPQNLVLV